MKYKPILYITSILVLVWAFLEPDGNKENIQILGGIGVFTLIYSLSTWIKLGNELLSPYSVFLGVLYIFSYGVPMLYAFGIVPEDDIVGYLDITYQQFYDSCSVSLIMLCFFHIGALSAHAKIIRRKTNDANCETHILNDPRLLKRLNKAAWTVAIVSAYFYVSHLIETITTSMLYGYGALYEKSDTTAGVLSGISGMLATMFIPSLICLFVANRNNTYYTRAITLIFIAIIGAGFMTGARSGSVILLVLLLILYNSFIYKFTRKAYIFVFAVFLLLMPVLTYIAGSRSGSDRTFDLSNVEFGDNAIVSAVAEMGGSQSCLIETMKFVPSTEPFRYGKSYIYSFATIVPNLGFWKVHPAVKEAGLAKWLPNKLGLTYGTGFSMFAEAYINFGYFGFIMIYWLGYLFAYIFGYLNNAIRSGDYVIAAAILIFFNETLGLPRAQTVDIMRSIYFIIIPLIFYCKRSLRLG